MKVKIIVAMLCLICLAFLPKTAKAVDTAETYFKSIKVSEMEKDFLKPNPQLPKEIYAIPEKPHYLLGINHIPESGYSRLMELRKVWQMKDVFYGYNGAIYIDKSVEQLGLHKNDNYLQLTSDIEVAGKKIFVIYPYHLLSDSVNKEFIYMSPLGPKNLAEFSPLYEKYKVQWAIGQISDKKWTEIKRVLGWAQFEAVKQHLYGCVGKAVVWDVKKFYGFADKVVKKQQELLADPDYAKKISQSVSELNGFKVGDLMLIPSTEPQDFLPDTLVFGPLTGAWGIANWKIIGSERIVFYDIIGAAYDFIKGEPLVLSHEFTHTNPYLQNTPVDLYFNVEMWTALTNDLADDLMYFNHPYLYVVADEVHTYFGYNAEEAISRIWPSRFVSLRDFNRKAYEENIKMVQQIRSALEGFIIEVFMPTFYADTYFWNTINTKWCDTAAAWRIMMAFYFEPAIIFDSKKTDEAGKIIPGSVQTKQWLAEQEAAGKIQKLAEEAMKKTGELTKLGQEMSKIEDYQGLIKCPSDSGFYSMPPKKQKEIIGILEQMMKENDSRFFQSLGHLFRIRGR